MKIKNIIHWNIFKKTWTSHIYKSCTHPSVILVEGEWSTEVKPNKKSNPRGWVICDHTQVTHDPSKKLLQQFSKTEQLTYDKINMKFNITEGDGLICDSTGCWLVERK